MNRYQSAEDAAPLPLSTPTKISRTPPSPFSSTAYPTPMSDTKHSRRLLAETVAPPLETGEQLTSIIQPARQYVPMNVEGAAGASTRLSIEVSEEDIIMAQIAKMLSSSEVETGTHGEGVNATPVSNFSAASGEEKGFRTARGPIDSDSNALSWNDGGVSTELIDTHATHSTAALKTVRGVNRIPASRTPTSGKRAESDKREDMTVSTAEMGNISDVREVSNVERSGNRCAQHNSRDDVASPAARFRSASFGRPGDTPLENENSLLTQKQMLSKCQRQAVEIRRAHRACYASDMRIVELENQLKTQHEETLELRTRLLLEREERRQAVAELSCRIEEEAVSKSDLARRKEELEKELRTVNLAHLQELNDRDAELSSNHEKIEALVFELREVEESWTRERTTLLSELEMQRIEAQNFAEREQLKNTEIEKLNDERKSLREALAVADSTCINMERKTLAKEKSLSIVTETVESLKANLLSQESRYDELRKQSDETQEKAEKTAGEVLEMRHFLDTQRRLLEEAETTRLSLEVSLGQCKQREHISNKRVEEMERNLFALKKSTVPSEAADALQEHYKTSMEALRERMQSLEGSLSEEMYRRRNLAAAVARDGKHLMKKLGELTEQLRGALPSASNLPQRGLPNDDNVSGGGESKDSLEQSMDEPTKTLQDMSAQVELLSTLIQSACCQLAQNMDAIHTLETAHAQECEEARRWRGCAGESAEQVSNLTHNQRSLEEQLNDVHQALASETANGDEARARIRQYEIVLRRVVSELESGIKEKFSWKPKAHFTVNAPSGSEETCSHATRPSTSSALSTTGDSECSHDDSTSARVVDTTAVGQQRSEGGIWAREEETRAPTSLPRLSATSDSLLRVGPETSLRRLVQVAHTYQDRTQTTERDREAMASEIRRLTVQLKAQERKATERLKASKQKATEWHQEAEAHAKEIADLKTRNADLESTCYELQKNAKTTVESCEGQLRAVTTKLTGELAEVADRVNVLQHQKECVETDLESCKQDRAQLHRVLEALEEEVERRESESRLVLRALQDVCCFYAVSVACSTHQALTRRFAQRVAQLTEYEGTQALTRLSTLGNKLEKCLALYERGGTESEANPFPSLSSSSSSSFSSNCEADFRALLRIRRPLAAPSPSKFSFRCSRWRAAVIALLVCIRLRRLLRSKTACANVSIQESEVDPSSHSERSEPRVPFSVVSTDRCREFLKYMARSGALLSVGTFSLRDGETARLCFSSEDEVRELLHQHYAPKECRGRAHRSTFTEGRARAYRPSSMEELILGLLNLLESPAPRPIASLHERRDTLLDSLVRGHNSFYDSVSVRSSKRRVGGLNSNAVSNSGGLGSMGLLHMVDTVIMRCSSLTDVLSIFSQNHQIIAEDVEALQGDLQRSKEQILRYAEQVNDIQQRAGERCSASVADRYRTRIEELSGQLDKERELRRRAELARSLVQQQEIGLLAAKFDVLREARSLTMELDVCQRTISESTRNSVLIANSEVRD